jgi:deoxyribodipyrimidine photo-lyase
MKNILVWFRNDLRIHDHQPLLEALSKGSSIIPVFILDTRNLKTPTNPKGMGVHRLKFILESLHDLKKTFNEYNSELIIKQGITEDLISELAVKYDAQAVYAFKEVTSEEIKISEALEKKLWKNKIPLTLYLGNTLYNKEDLPFPIKDIPDLFTNFRKRVEKDSEVRPCVNTPKSFGLKIELEKTCIPTLDDLGYKECQANSNADISFKGGESNALSHLNTYIWEKQSIVHYKKTRNEMLGMDFSSKLSAWLSCGCISPRKVYWEIKKFEEEIISNESTYWLFFELLWRDYFRFMFKKYGNALFREDGIRKVIRTDKSKNEDSLFELWKEGKTGIPFVDANMIELKETGYMSNRGRQNVASFLINDLHVTWTKGAEWFEENLIDYNPASNWGNWAYIAGVGNDLRENRHFNILKQANEYDPKGDYVRHWLPVLKDLPNRLVHQPSRMTLDEQKNYNLILDKAYPKEIIPLRRELF